MHRMALFLILSFFFFQFAPSEGMFRSPSRSSIAMYENSGVPAGNAIYSSPLFVSGPVPRQPRNSRKPMNPSFLALRWT
uniref:Secreted protein n=1 Tax=Panagrolaimus sp. JU765 TaxID=591449 RepID=A0AC34Q8S2_9BILA